LAEGNEPEVVNNAVILLPDSSAVRRPVEGGSRTALTADVSFYDPWKNKWEPGKAEDNKITLPDFTRSLVVRMRY
jgi:hypothetical protein